MVKFSVTCMLQTWWPKVKIHREIKFTALTLRYLWHDVTCHSSDVRTFGVMFLSMSIQQYILSSVWFSSYTCGKYPTLAAKCSTAFVHILLYLPFQSWVSSIQSFLELSCCCYCWGGSGIGTFFIYKGILVMFVFLLL